MLPGEKNKGRKYNSSFSGSKFLWRLCWGHVLGAWTYGNNQVDILNIWTLLSRSVRQKVAPSRLNCPAFISQFFHSHIHTFSTGSGCSKFKQDVQARYEKRRKEWEEGELQWWPMSAVIRLRDQSRISVGLCCLHCTPWCSGELDRRYKRSPGT